MILTIKSRYAVIALVEVVSNHSTRPIKIADISRKQAISLNYLEQIFLKLKKAKILKSVRGPGGGYYLNIPLESLNIMKIIDAVGENTKMTKCSLTRCESNRVKCITHYLWEGLSDKIRNYFSSILVIDLISKKLSQDSIYIGLNNDLP